TAKITTKLVVVYYANAGKAEDAGISRRGDWLLCRAAIDTQECLEARPPRTRLAEWVISQDKVVVGMIACFKPQKSPIDFVDMAAQGLKQNRLGRVVVAGGRVEGPAN